ncbi:mannonate dehydratase [Paenibacillus piri]|uniref:mannonate dehydratase n=1 Tax=Paenibacillus piri TaxID=2547395 RepID=A0A4R5KP70_9BACL|nr:mannonate dehydratase [Paenibacillus piri]TDF97499.1 mannonate dehydratase [Paenibacillus piri]
MKVSVTLSRTDVSDSHLRLLTQIGVDCIDFGSGSSFAGVKEQGFPDLDALIKLRKRIQSWGMDINRATLPDLSSRFVDGLEGGEQELEHSVTAMRVFGEAGIPIVRQRIQGDNRFDKNIMYSAKQRGGLTARGENWANRMTDLPTQEEQEHWWSRFCEVYSRLVPAAEEHNLLLAMHPTDTPLPGMPYSSLGFHRIIDAFPSKRVGYVYCVGTRGEAGGSSLVLDEIQHYGRKGRIFSVHLRNVRGSLATAYGFEETLLDDGDMNMFRIVLALHKIGFTGCLNADHMPQLEGDDSNHLLAWTYSVGYIKALLAALAEYTGQ